MNKYKLFAVMLLVLIIIVSCTPERTVSRVVQVDAQQTQVTINTTERGVGNMCIMTGQIFAEKGQ